MSEAEEIKTFALFLREFSAVEQQIQEYLYLPKQGARQIAFTFHLKQIQKSNLL